MGKKPPERLLEIVLLELRYDEGFTYWDVIGHIAKDLFKRYPSMEMESVGPEYSEFMVENQVSFRVAHDRTTFRQQYPKELKVFSEVAEAASEIVARNLEIREYKRIGYRSTYSYAMSEDHAKEIITAICTPLPIGEWVNLEENKTSRMAFRTETKEEGYTFELSAASRELNLANPPPFVKLEESKAVTEALLASVDAFTKGSVAVDIGLIDFLKAKRDHVESALDLMVKR